MRVPADAFDLDKLPPHLRITFRVMDGEKVVATGKDLAALQRQLRPKVRATLSARATALTRTGVTRWDFGPLPKVFTDGEVKAYPALVDAGAAVDVRLFETAAAAAPGDAGRDQAARPADGEVARQRGRQAADHRAEAGAERQPARLGRRPVRRLRQLRGRRPDRRGGRPRLGRRGVRPARPSTSGPGCTPPAYEVVTWAEEILRAAHDARLRLDGLRSPVLEPAAADIRPPA